MHQVHDIFAAFGKDRPHVALDDRAFADLMAGLRSLLISYARKQWPSLLLPEYERRMREARIGSDQSVTFEMLGEVCCTYRLPDGRTPVQVFADEVPGLFAEQRDTLRRWTEVKKGPFDIVEQRGQKLEVTGSGSVGPSLLVTPCLVASPPGFMVPGTLLIARLVPVRDFFIHLGVFQLVQKEDREQAARFLRQKLNLTVRSLDRWTPQEGQAAPASEASCPCGSGRRYRKCCRPR